MKEEEANSKRERASLLVFLQASRALAGEAESKLSRLSSLLSSFLPVSFTFQTRQLPAARNRPHSKPALPVIHRLMVSERAQERERELGEGEHERGKRETTNQ